MQWMRQLGSGHASALKCQEGKDSSFLIQCNSFALWCIVEKNKQILGFEEA